MEAMIRAALVLFFSSALALESQSLQASPDQTKTQPQPTSQAAAQLAARISSLLTHRTIGSLDWQNLAPLPSAEWSNFRTRFELELRKAGVETVGTETAATPPEPRLRVTASQDAHQLLFIAELSSGDTRQVAILPWPAMPPKPEPRLRLIPAPLFSLSLPVLDVLGDDTSLLVLSTNQVTRYRESDGKWWPDAAVPLSLSRPMPRDPRGRLEATAQGFRAYLPIGTCEGTAPELRLTCSPEISTWQSMPVHWAADRNVLEGASPAPVVEGWGSDRAALVDPCGAGIITIADSPNDEHDSVRAYQVADGGAAPASDPLPVAGPVTALWPANSGREATLVVHNLQTGEYEASRVLLACVQ